MRDTEYNAVRDYCKDLAIRWITLTGCGWDHVELLWSDQYFSVEKDGHPPDCLAYCDADWRYLHASIVFSVPKLAEKFDQGQPKNPSEIRELVVHELMHVLLNEMREYDKSDHTGTVGHEERVATRLARAFTYTWDEASKCSTQP